MWIVKSWRELPEDRHDPRYIGASYKDYCVDGVFATVKAANAKARRARDRMEDKYEYALSEEEEDEGQEEEEGTEEEEEKEDEGADDEEAKKVKDEEPFLYYRHLGWDGEDVGTLHVVVEKRTLH